MVTVEFTCDASLCGFWDPRKTKCLVCFTVGSIGCVNCDKHLHSSL